MRCGTKEKIKKGKMQTSLMASLRLGTWYDLKKGKNWVIMAPPEVCQEMRWDVLREVIYHTGLKGAACGVL